MKKIFITGTDTGVGKTYIAVQLIRAFQQKGLSTIGLKPLATGCHQTADGLRNDDALQLQQASSVLCDYSIINPFAFLPSIAPHIAAAYAGQYLSVAVLQDAIFFDMKTALGTSVDVCIIEGVGGWLTPLNNTETMADYVLAENCDVILVVGMRLGCINHALLTMDALYHSGLNVLGWIANTPAPEPMTAWSENIATLSIHLPVPCLGVFTHCLTKLIKNHAN